MKTLYVRFDRVGKVFVRKVWLILLIMIWSNIRIRRHNPSGQGQIPQQR